MKYKNIRQLVEETDFVLGSRSPRRRELLAEISTQFRCLVPQIDEIRQANESPVAFACRLAEQKALDVSQRSGPDSVTLGSDTIVVLGELVLQKPDDEQQAFAILRKLSGKQHIVCTALALIRGATILASAHELTTVYFNDPTDDQIRRYITTGESMDKAGAYGIQGMGAFLVDRIEGCLDNVIGLPRKLLERLAKEVLLKM
jgi:septum formation protein